MPPPKSPSIARSALSSWRFKNGWFRLPSLEKKTKSFIGVTTRSLGNMKDPAAFARALRRAGLAPSRWAGGQQVHGRRVRWVKGASTRAEGFPKTDGVATDVPGLALRAFAADCVAVFVVDAKRSTMALVHAGWRGTVKGVLGRAVALLKKRGGRAKDFWAVLGPHIRPCCYEVGPDVARHFREVPGAAVRRASAAGAEKFSLDLSRALARQARSLGIPAGRFIPSPFCTAHDPRFFSYRRDKTDARSAAVVALAQ